MSKLLTRFSRSNRLTDFNLRTCRRETYSTNLRFSEDDVEEIKIPVPWGHIAGKWWGQKNENPLIGIHGWQENAGTYDRLIPLLNVPNFLAIDLPGHGFSSHLPSGKLYTFPEYIYILRRIVKYFNWKKYSLFGHSFGSSLGFAYSSIYTDEIEYFISFECARSLLLAFAVNYPYLLAQGIDKLLENEKKLKNECAPSYTLSEIVQSCITGSLGSVNSSESALVLLKRGATKCKASDVSAGKMKKKSDLKVFLDHELSNNEELQKHQTYEKLMNNVEETKLGDTTDSEYVYKFTKDPRVKLSQFGVLNDELILEFANYITCPVLSIEAEDGFLKLERKYWGRRSGKPFLLLHGWQDNAGSFDTLVPLLPKEYSYLAIDLPGHGFSSHYPPGVFYTTQDSISSLRRIQKYFDWPKMSLIGHSLGSMLSFVFSSVYNEDVDVYIGLDTITPLVEIEKYHSKVKERIEKFLEYDSFQPEGANSYKEEDFISKLKKALKTNDENICKIIMKRGAVQKDGLFSPVRDPRIKASNPFNSTPSDLLKMAERINCNVLIIKSLESIYIESEKHFYEVLDVIKRNAKHLEFVKVPGTHHFHLETPQVAAQIIQKFLNDIK